MQNLHLIPQVRQVLGQAEPVKMLTYAVRGEMNELDRILVL